MIENKIIRCEYPPSSREPPVYFEFIPTEIFTLILSNLLNEEDVKNLSLVNKKLNILSLENACFTNIYLTEIFINALCLIKPKKELGTDSKLLNFHQVEQLQTIAKKFKSYTTTNLGELVVTIRKKRAEISQTLQPLNTEQIDYLKEATKNTLKPFCFRKVFDITYLNKRIDTAIEHDNDSVFLTFIDIIADATREGLIDLALKSANHLFMIHHFDSPLANIINNYFCLEDFNTQKIALLFEVANQILDNQARFVFSTLIAVQLLQGKDKADHNRAIDLIFLNIENVSETQDVDSFTKLFNDIFKLNKLIEQTTLNDIVDAFIKAATCFPTLKGQATIFINIAETLTNQLTLQFTTKIHSILGPTINTIQKIGMGKDHSEVITLLGKFTKFFLHLKIQHQLQFITLIIELPNDFPEKFELLYAIVGLINVLPDDHLSSKLQLLTYINENLKKGQIIAPKYLRSRGTSLNRFQVLVTLVTNGLENCKKSYKPFSYNRI